MIVAELQITASNGIASNGFSHAVRFNTTEKASSEFHRIAELLQRREDRANDLPKMVEIQGDTNSLSLPLNTIQSVGWLDFALANEQTAGLRETFPHIFTT